MRTSATLLLLLHAAATVLALRVGGGGIAGAGIAGFLGWAFQGVGPSPEAKALATASPPAKVSGGLLFGTGPPVVALYCGAKVRRESYAPLALSILDKLKQTDAGVLVLQSPLNVYAFKPMTVSRVLELHPSVTCIAGHSIGGLWAVEFCREMHSRGEWPSAGLDFFYMGVHGKGLSLDKFMDLPFRKVGWSWASEDCTMLRAAEGDVPAYVARTRDELPAGAAIFEIAGGNHEQYGSYGSPGFKQGLAYKDLPARISAEEQCELAASAIAATASRN